MRPSIGHPVQSFRTVLTTTILKIKLKWEIVTGQSSNSYSNTQQTEINNWE